MSAARTAALAAEFDAILATLPPSRERRYEPEIEGPDCGSVTAHRSGSCDCWGLS
jgi:hypothetical protein